MAEKRKDMMPIADGRYHLTVYFKNPRKICSPTEKKGKNDEKKFLIQTGASWRKTMNVPRDEKLLRSTAWVKGNYVPFMGKLCNISPGFTSNVDFSLCDIQSRA